MVDEGLLTICTQLYCHSERNNVKSKNLTRSFANCTVTFRFV